MMLGEKNGQKKSTRTMNLTDFLSLFMKEQKISIRTSFKPHLSFDSILGGTKQLSLPIWTKQQHTMQPCGERRLEKVLNKKALVIKYHVPTTTFLILTTLCAVGQHQTYA